MRKLILFCAGAFSLCGACLLFASFLTIGINDGEWRNLSEKGTFSQPEAVIWERWRLNEDSIQPFPGTEAANRHQSFLVVRDGVAKGWLFSFTIWEGRVEGDERPQAAIGYGWGAHYSIQPAVYSLVIAFLFLVWGFHLRKAE
ncbi:MAG: hypothetical protein QM796_21310 [Chthoniobacteraceae bacterium]